MKTRRGRGQSAKNRRRKPSFRVAMDDSDDEENITTKWKSDRLPKYDEYVFDVNRWLADDEDDGQISRTLKPKSITTFYKMGTK